ncbi:MAG: DEAD/DEAH box helicase [Leptospiraceae bacterium]|nr:DEAD/DEAH box helicase [Leptospiraceae bacterium]
MLFKDLPVHPDIQKALSDQGLETLTQIQEDTFEPALAGRDIVGISQTGTGKTIAFLLPVISNIIQSLDKGEAPAALILTPTREICIQIAEEVEKLITHYKLNIATIFGGDSYDRQEKELAAKPSVIVATPGRLIDYIKQNKFPVASIRHLILDEADRMFDMGFIRDIRYIMKKLPEKSQTMLFSATMSYYVMRLAWDFMHDPVEVRTKAQTIEVDKIDQHLFHLGREEKLPYLLNLVLAAEQPRAIVFTNYKRKVLDITRKLHKYGVAATGLSSLLDQKKRVRLLKQFKLGKYNILVATDVASRGLDVDDITHVFNFDLPQDSESYVHRIGRTARAGKSGVSYSFCSEDDFQCLPRIEQLLRHKIPVSTVDPNFVKYPEGDFKPFRDESERAHAESEGGESGNRRKNQNRSRSRNRKNDRPQDRESRNNRDRTDNRKENATAGVGEGGQDGRRRRRRRRPDRRESTGNVEAVGAGGADGTVRDQDRARLLGRDKKPSNGAPRNGGGKSGGRGRNNRRNQNQGRNRTGNRDQNRRPTEAAPAKPGLFKRILGVFKRSSN